jgi:hypothetical protein
VYIGKPRLAARSMPHFIKVEDIPRRRCDFFVERSATSTSIPMS